ncbi:MAG: hypothetical protein NZ108_04950 [Bacteroidia bacterium]|nr:hypothetical protein [Bacteroidia bacterium]
MQKKNRELDIPLIGVIEPNLPVNSLQTTAIQPASQSTTPKPKIGTKIPTNLKQVNLKKQETIESGTEILHVPIPIDPVKFTIALGELVSVIESEARNSLIAILKNRPYHIEINKYIFTVVNELERDILTEARERIVLFLREKCNNPTIIQEVIVDESLKPEKTFLTDEDKKRLMEEKNPFLRLLQKKFNTQLDYR